MSLPIGIISIETHCNHRITIFNFLDNIGNLDHTQFVIYKF